MYILTAEYNRGVTHNSPPRNTKS